jgi:hypothetical protein
VRKTPEIPADVFFGDDAADEAPGTQEAPSSRRQTKPKPKARAATTPREHKVQVTIYLSDEAAKVLERARFELLTKHDVRASKSAIAEYAIGRVGGDITAMAKALAGGG